MRRILTIAELLEGGRTYASVRWQVKTGVLQRVAHGAYVEGSEPPTELEKALGTITAAAAIASGSLAGVLYGLDSVELNGADGTVTPTRGGHRTRTRRRAIGEDVRTVKGIVVVSPLQALVDLAATLDDARWEHALESALRMKLLTVSDIETRLPALSRARTPGVRRMRRVLALRPPGAPPTESLLETLMVQLIRAVGAPEPIRQVRIWRHGRVIARVDLAWPELGVFIELDGQHHRGQPVYDAARETAVVAATGWLPGRFTWRQVVHHPEATARELLAVLAQARARPL